jgi:hypothetical protein
MLDPRTSTYRVRRGDTLSRIAERQYGTAAVWPEIAGANRLPHGNLILVGMNLKLPSVHDPRRPSMQRHPSAERFPQRPADQTSVSTMLRARPVRYPAVKYSFDAMKVPPIFRDKVEISIKLTGEVAIQPKGPLVQFELTRDSAVVSGKLKSEIDSRFFKMASNVSVKWDPGKNTAEMSCGFTLATKINGREFVSHEYKVVPPNRLKYSMSPREIEGELDDAVFKGKLGFEVEITVRDDGTGRPKPVLVGDRIAVSMPRTEWIVAGGLVLLGTAIIVADLGKDVVTFGAGAAESPLSFAVAMAMFRQAGALAL